MTRQLCTFTLENLALAVPVSEVQEVIREVWITPVPQAPPGVRGLINLRGQIVTVIDLRRCLELPGEREADMHVVLRRDGTAVSLLVDDIGDVIEVDPASAATPPRTLDGVLRRLLANVYKLDDGLLLVLASPKLISLILDEVSQ